METIMTDSERYFREYIKRIEGNLDDVDLNKWLTFSHKQLFITNSPEIFHSIALDSGTRQINERGAIGLYYLIQIPNNNGELPHSWEIILEEYKKEEFKSKYGPNYKIIKI